MRNPGLWLRANSLWRGFELRLFLMQLRCGIRNGCKPVEMQSRKNRGVSGKFTRLFTINSGYPLLEAFQWGSEFEPPQRTRLGFLDAYREPRKNDTSVARITYGICRAAAYGCYSGDFPSGMVCVNGNAVVMTLMQPTAVTSPRIMQSGDFNKTGI